MLEHSNDPLFWSDFLKRIYSNGIRHIHSSNEYKSFPLLTECLERLNHIGINFSHIIKLAEPSFDERKFSEERFLSKIDFYKMMLPGKIETIQWMWRSEGADNERIASFLKQKKYLEIVFKNYNICCFPYSIEFADKALELRNLNGLIFYWNQDEKEYFSSANKASEKNKVNYILRPFGSGKNIRLTSSDMLDYCKEIPNLRGIIFTATKDKHLKEAINFFKSI